MRNKLYKSVTWAIFIFLGTFFIGCAGFLDEKPDAKLATIATLDDLQALLNDNSIVNESGPGEGEVSSDDYFLSDEDYNSLSYESYRQLYRWDNSILLTDLPDNGWIKGYKLGYLANTVIEKLSEISNSDKNRIQKASLLGQAYFHRALAYFEMIQIWCLAFDDESSSLDLGLPLRLQTDFNVKTNRSSLSQSYAQIVGDLKSSISLLPVTLGSKWRPSKIAGYGLLSRVYLFMRNYENAYAYADSCLQLNNQLLNFNDVDLSSDSPFNPDVNNPEVLYFREIVPLDPINSYTGRLSRQLYNMYEPHDLRKVAYFRARSDGDWRYKGSYYGGGRLFAGIATDEIYLIRSECSLRLGNLQASLNDLNHLLQNRWSGKDDSNTYVKIQTEDKDKILQLIINERRKELVFRGLRWGDIKRLNKEGVSSGFSRTISGQTYNLPANDLRFAIPIPLDVISISHIEQNLR